MDRLQSMRVFMEVVDERGFAAAARKLDLDPAVVTRLVADLERDLGVRLLHRTTRRLALTPAGEDYLSRLRAILRELDEANARARDHLRAMKGRIRILASPVVATHMLAPAVAPFQRRHPDVTLEIRVADLPNPPFEEFDLTLMNGALPIPNDVIVRPVTASHGVFCASPDYLRRHGTPRTPQDLPNHRVLRLRPSHGRLGRLRLQDADDATREVHLDVAPALIADHTDTLLRATVDGAGISSQPEDIIAPFVNAGVLRRVLAPWITTRLTLVAAFTSRKLLPARTRVFLDHLIEHTQAGTAAAARQPATRAGRES